ncbi:DUF1992 domain-containing protein [Actinomycetota bacterium]|nr:DUF1992 domain-containing protein [Micrococcales bacterium]
MSQHHESHIERQIREAVERGDFDNLSGAGKPLPDMGEHHDEEWWVKQLVKREQLDMSGALPPVLALRKEAGGFPASLVELRTEQSVRAVLEDFNRRVREDRLRPAVGPFPPLLARTVDVDELVEQWRALRADRTEAPADQASRPQTKTPVRQGFWARTIRRGRPSG